MEGSNHGLSWWEKTEALLQGLAPRIVLIHQREALSETQLLIRFANGYGVALLPLAPPEDDAALEMLVLGFYGPKIDDFKLVQYAPIPEFSVGNYEEVLALCRQVALLPRRPGITFSTPPAAARIEKEEWEQRCSNF